MKCTGYERGTFEERSARTESSPRQSGKNSEDDSRANNNIRETLGILSRHIGFLLHPTTGTADYHSFLLCSPTSLFGLLCFFHLFAFVASADNDDEGDGADAEHKRTVVCVNIARFSSALLIRLQHK